MVKRSIGRIGFKLRTKPDHLIIPFCTFLAFFTLSFIASSFIIQPQPTKAVTGLGLVGATASITLASDISSLELNPTPGLNDGLASGSHNLTASTNIPAGYHLTLSTLDTPTFTATTGTHASPAPLANNSWGYALAGMSNFDPSYATPTPSTTSKWADPTEGATIKNTTNSVTSDQTTIYYGAKIDLSQASGLYTNTVRYTAIANIANIPEPTIISLTPDSGTTAGGTTITIVGTGFTVNDQSVTTAVIIGATSCNNISISSNTPATGQDTITCHTPARAAGAVRTAIVTLGGTANLASGYTYVAPADVAAVSPSLASTVPGSESGPAFSISGTNFTGATSVTIGGIACTSFKVVVSTHIFCIAPNTINTAGNKAIAVTKTVGTGTTGGTSSASVTYSNTNYPTFQSSSAYANCSTTAQLYRDERDSQLYYVKKMPDNKCWMVDNLKYANFGAIRSNHYTYMTVDGTNTESSENIDVAKYADLGAYAFCVGDTDMPANTNTRCGLAYNWYAVTNGTGVYAMSTSGVQATGSICPANFRLPSTISGTGGPTTDGNSYTAGDFPVLNGSMQAGTLTTGSINGAADYMAGWLPDGMWSGVLGGGVAGSNGIEGKAGIYWASSVHNGSYARTINIIPYEPGDGKGVRLEMSGYNYKLYGMPARCVMEGVPPASMSLPVSSPDSTLAP